MKTEDGSIISKCLNGDHDAFGLLVEKYKDGVYALAYSRLRNPHNAEDVSQEVFIKVYEKLHTLRRWDKFDGWLYRMTIRLCINYLEAQSIRPDREHTEDNSSEIFDNQTMDSYHAESKFNELHESLDSLSEEHREVIILHYFSGMTSFEISKFVGVSPDAIRRRLMRARSILKEEILNTISIAFNEQKLHAGFTPRILEMTRYARIHPIPREIIIPWGASLTGAIIVAILAMSAGLMIVRSYYDVPVSSESSGVIGSGQVPVYVVNKAEIESGGGTGMISGKKIGAFVTVMAALAVLSSNAQVDWTKWDTNNDGVDPVIPSLNGLSVRHGCVIYDEGIYKMWYNVCSSGHSDIAYATATLSPFDNVYNWNYDADGDDQYDIVMRTGPIWDNQYVNEPFVIKDDTEPLNSDKRYKMWYTGHNDGEGSIGYAYSGNGITWNKYADSEGNQVPVATVASLGLPVSGLNMGSIMRDSTGTYKMWLHTDTNGVETPYAIYYTTSSNGVEWSNAVLALSHTSDEWDSRGVRSPCVIFNDELDKYQMWYQGVTNNGYISEFGYAISNDGITWEKHDANNDGNSDPVMLSGAPGALDDQGIDKPVVIFKNSVYEMWYTGYYHDYSSRVFYATAPMENQPPVTAQINIDPDTLNLKANGNWVTCYIQPPDGFSAQDIDVSSIKLQGTLTVEQSDIQDSVLMVKFNRDKLITYIKGLNLPLPTDVSLEVTGKFISGKAFIGSDTIKVINPGNGKKSLAKASEFTLLSAYPQPFNPEVWIPYKLGDSVQVKFSIYNANGNLVRTLNLGYKPEGSYTSIDKAAYWDGRNEAGEQVSSGIYFYNIQAGNFSATKKMIVKK